MNFFADAYFWTEGNIFFETAQLSTNKNEFEIVINHSFPRLSLKKLYGSR